MIADTNPHDFFHQGVQIAREGHIGEGIRLLRQYVQDNPQDLDGWGHLGYLLQLTDDLQGAVQCYSRVCELAPGLLEPLLRLSDCLLHLGERKQARLLLLKLQHTPAFEEEEVQRRLAALEPFHQRVARRFIPLLKLLLKRSTDPKFHRAVWHELLVLPHSLHAIRHTGLNAWLVYLSRHLLQGNSYQIPIRPCDFCGNRKFQAIFYHKDQKKVRCPRCGLQFVEKRPVDGQEAAMGFYQQPEVIEHFQKNWLNPAVMQHRWSLLEQGLKSAGRMLAPSARIFEVGCGQGHFLALLEEKGFRVAGIETAPALVSACRTHFGLEVSLATVRSLTDTSPVWDLILAYHVIEHLDEPSSLFELAQRLLTPHGVLLIETPIPDLLTMPLAKQLDDQMGYANNGHMHYFTTETLSAYFDRFGFQLLSTYRLYEETFPVGGFLLGKVDQ